LSVFPNAHSGFADAGARPTEAAGGICLEKKPPLNIALGMTFTEIKPQLDGLNVKERRKLAAYVRHSLRVETEENRRELARRNRAMAAGKTYDLGEVKALLAKLHRAPDAG